jgi:hypothetical protein
MNIWLVIYLSKPIKQHTIWGKQKYLEATKSTSVLLLSFKEFMCFTLIGLDR